MQIRLKNPTTIILPDCSEKVLSFLTYKDNSVQFLINKLRQNRAKGWVSPEQYELKLAKLNSEIDQCLVFFDSEGNACTHSGLAYELCQEFGWQLPSPPDEREWPRIAWKSKPQHEMRYYQSEAVEALLRANHGAISLPTGCHAKGTPILLFNGSLKNVEDVAVGDLLMGPDSTPRRVLSLHTGTQDMVTIVPVKGEEFTVNIDHILSLKNTQTKEIVNISVRDYMGMSNNFKHLHKLYRTGISLPSRCLPIPPYILGLWLGDGSSRDVELTSMDPEIIREWTNWGNSFNNFHVVCRNNGSLASIFSVSKQIKQDCDKSSEVKELFRQYNLLSNKHIPEDYLTSSISQRLELLAGLMDTDGSLSKGCFDFIQKNKLIAEQTVRLARSVGLAAYMSRCFKKSQTGSEGQYWRVSISGQTSIIPCRLPRKQANVRTQTKDALVTGFTIKKADFDVYYGFEVDQDNLYVMGDFTVTHNSGKSRVIIELVKARPVKTVIMAPLTDITDQLFKELVQCFGKNNVAKYKPKKKQDKLITVATVQALTRCIPGTPEYDSLLECESVIVDESHTIAAESFKKVCLEGPARNAVNRWFVSATQIRGDGSGLLLKGVTGPVVYSKDFMELAQQGFLKKLKNHIITVPIMTTPTTDPKTEIRNNFYRNTHIAMAAAKIAAVNAKSGRPCVILIDEYEQFALIEKHMTVPFMFAHGTVSQDARKVIDPQWWKSDNKKIVEKFNNGECMCLIGTTAVSTGVDIKPTATLVNWQGGKSEIKIKQGVGRGTRPSKEHPYLYMVDFVVKGSKTLERYAKIRTEIYEEFSDLPTVYV